MLNKLRTFTLGSLAIMFAGSFGFNDACAAVNGINNYNISQQNAWRFTEDRDFSYAQGSPSRWLSINELVLHHTLGIKVNKNMVDSYSFKVGCMLQSATPMFELRVNSLDIRLMDSVNDYVFARFLVDKNQEFSLRGDLVGRNRILFAPITKKQDSSLSDLFLQLREGGELKIALLQGTNGQARVYKVPLDGFLEYADQLLDSCQKYHSYYRSEQKFLPDYMTQEPEGYAPKDYSLLPKDPITDPFAPVQPATPESEESPTQVEPDKPDVIPFTPGGGPASIGPDGLPIGNTGANQNVQNGQVAEQSFGTASGPMQIGADGKPIPANQTNQAPATEQSPEEGGILDSIF